MEYIEVFNQLKKTITYKADRISVNDKVIIRNFDFESKFYSILPGGKENEISLDNLMYCNKHKPESEVIKELSDIKDADITENKNFRYHVMMPRGEIKSKNILLFFHGFNEKFWMKYFPWAQYILEKTGKPVILFPLAFHMNRAPALWSNSKEMYSISKQRQQRYPNLIASSFSNVAISTRLHHNPLRFIWSGFQTYYDVIELITSIKTGLHPIIHTDAKFDIFSYSIGSLLSEILMMTNSNGYFSQSRLVSFCGGATFNNITPVSKSILDNEAHECLLLQLGINLENHMKKDTKLYEYMENSPEGKNFRSMLNSDTFIVYRENKFNEISERIYAIALKKDKVFPFKEIINTLKGRENNIPIRVDILDYPYNYSHEEPFPAKENIKHEVTEHFKKTFDLVCDFLTQ
ncbi:MAG: DUF6051 family protein [Bacteroidales bacterium]|jgi:hypothetical protein|nr:DUF6051 family protein [Bacteroidales bacterium]MDD3700437.1 DUF6051 family protein [Bacteroidales bacterium]MDY0368677.1 DUF6051 family protein [Bacteroidales bacterium]